MESQEYPYVTLCRLLALAYYRKYIICQKRLDKGAFPSITVEGKREEKGENLCQI
ncbi:MAG: hypothetical protein ACK5N8_04690 [Alphaproteobacteria bacterium]